MIPTIRLLGNTMLQMKGNSRTMTASAALKTCDKLASAGSGLRVDFIVLARCDAANSTIGNPDRVHKNRAKHILKD